MYVTICTVRYRTYAHLLPYKHHKNNRYHTQALEKDLIGPWPPFHPNAPPIHPLTAPLPPRSPKPSSKGSPSPKLSNGQPNANANRKERMTTTPRSTSRMKEKRGTCWRICLRRPLARPAPLAVGGPPVEVEMMQVTHRR